jgi:hypothetical protein
MKNANAIPTSQVPSLRLKCYHLSVHTSTVRHPFDAVLNHYGHSTFELVDPEEGTSLQIQKWLNDETADGGPPLRHLEIEDRNGVHQFVAQRRGHAGMFLENSIRFDAYTDYDSVLPNPGVTGELTPAERALQCD